MTLLGFVFQLDMADEVKESLEGIFKGSHNGELIKTLKQSHRFVEEIFVK